MKSFTASALSVALLASNVAAFPAMAMEQLEKRAINPLAPQGVGALPLAPPIFDPVAQRVSTTGQYKFVAPVAGDARGMCPGLNALANHGYIPHNGVATIQQFIDGTYKGFGMANDLGGFLAIYGSLVDGTLTSWSIAGVPHTGIAGSHGNYEGDSSPNYADLNQYGSNVKLVLSQFKTLYDLQPDASTANYNLEVLRQFRGIRYQESIDKNPYFTYNPFAGVLVSQAAFTFIYRFMANKSAQYPEGVLNKDVLKSFFSITGPDNNLKWTKGYERFPDVFYKRAIGDEYSITYFQTDILYVAETQPEALVVGCNQGTVDSFNAVDVSKLTGGAYDQAAVSQNPVCFGLSYAVSQLPVFTGASAAQLAPLNTILSTLGCKAITSPAPALLAACPGLSIYGGPTAPVAPGSIQS